MKKYVRFYKESSGFTWENGEMVECEKFLEEGLASNSVFWLDGRNSLDRNIDEAFNRAHQLRKVANFKAFKIMQTPSGGFSEGKAITELIYLPKSE